MMKKYKNTFIALAFMLLAPSLLAQEGFVHKESEQYVWPTNEELLNKLDEWQDLKFGVLFHWGYIQFLVLLNRGLFVQKMKIGFHEIVQLLMLITKENIGSLSISSIPHSSILTNGLM